jgi:SNF2 family DNA or RNA helicase
VLTSYSLLQRDFATLNQIAWSGIVLDEAQNIKNAEAKQAKAARELKAGAACRNSACSRARALP